MDVKDFLGAPVYRGEPVEFIIGSAAGAICPGSKQFYCSKCAAEVWLARSGQRRIKSTGAQPLCLDCFDRMNDPDKQVFRPSAEEMAGDLGGDN